MRGVRFTCPACGQHLEVDSGGAGIAIACPACGGHLVVPDALPAVRAGSTGKSRRFPYGWASAAIAILVALVAGAWYLNRSSRSLDLMPSRSPPDTAAQPIGPAIAEAVDPSTPAPPEWRTISFPSNQFLGNLYLEPRIGSGWDPVQLSFPYAWEYLCAGRGDVRVPKDRKVQLAIRLALNQQESARLRAQTPMKHQIWEACRLRLDPADLSGLVALRPDDLYRLTVDSLIKVDGADKRVIEPIRHLTGLQMLCLVDTGVTDEGMMRLEPLRSLRVLELGEPGVGSQGLTVLTHFPVLECLNLDIPVNDAALEAVGRHPTLRSLRLRTGRLQSGGLAQLARLPRLERLCLWGATEITDHHVRQLESLTSLKSLTVWGVGDNLSDASLISIGKLKKLEELYFVRTSPRFTPSGLTHLNGLANLKAVDFADTWSGPDRARCGDQLARQFATRFPRLEFVKGICGLTAEGLRSLAALQHLKTLSVALRDRPPGDTASSGLPLLADIGTLEELTLFTGNPLSDADLACLEPLGQLRELSIWNAPVSEAGLASIGKLRHLKSLSLSLINVAGLNQLNTLSSLQDLHLNRWPDPANRGFSDNATLSLPGLKSLRNLSLSGFTLQDGDLDFLQHLRLLEQLDINTTSSTGAFLTRLSHLPELKRLYVSGLSGCKGEYLSQLNTLPQLRDLHLTGDIDDDALVPLTGPPSLQSLDIDTTAPLSRQTVLSLTRSHPILEYNRIRASGSPATR